MEKYQSKYRSKLPSCFMRWLFLVLLLTGCVTVLTPQEAITKCITSCKEQTVQLDSQCIGELDAAWVCDVAHNPRTAADNLAENQCASYRDGSHKRFVEVTPSCQLIRAG